jgi:hypothetical protein
MKLNTPHAPLKGGFNTVNGEALDEVKLRGLRGKIENNRKNEDEGSKNIRQERSQTGRI